MTPGPWHAAYYSDLQSLFALLVVPLAFLAWRLAVPCPLERAVVPAAARFVSLATLVFAFATLLDPIVTGPIAKRAALLDERLPTLLLFLFVYLGDLRVLVVACAVESPQRRLTSLLGRAAVATAVVPISTGILYSALRALVPDVHGQWLWMIYEAGFLVLCVAAARIWLPQTRVDPAARALLGSLFGYSAAYYALWLGADLLIVVGGLDLGWAIRMVPNQLYYAFWVPFVYFRFFSAPPVAGPGAAEPGTANAAR